MPDGTTRVARPIAQRLVGADRPAGEHEVERPALPDQPRQPHGATVDQRHAPAPAEHAEHRVVGHHPEIAPERELEPARDRVTLDRGDHRLAEHPSGRAHRAVAVDRDAVHPRAAGFGHRLEVGAGAERAPGTGEHHDRERVVGLEAVARVDQRIGGRTVDRVAGVRAGRW